MVCNVITNPFWVVRTRMQAESFRNTCHIHFDKTYQGMFQSMKFIAQSEGMGALWSGLAASMLGISHALIYFPLYENLKLKLKQQFEPDS